ncbi:tRNA 2-thiouridine(34) synthase MnmA, partial [Candidatus Parcubacteria bacterium]|nr:tRNA 2-thiouridine(34) synthase MnmA [Candidatus Parcubacteria bacterium]
KDVSLKDVNWTHGISTGPLQCRIRYRQKLENCVIEPDAKKMTVKFDAPQEAVSVGQSLVFYKGDECLGGGIIDKTL